MKQIQLENYGQKLRMLQVDTWTSSFTLHEIDDVAQTSPGKTVATMKIPNWWNESGIIESDGKTWTLHQKGWLSWKYGIVDSESKSAVGEMRQFVFHDNELEMFGSGFYKIRNFNFFSTEWGIIDQFGRTLVRFYAYGRGFGDFFKTQSDIKLVQGFEKQPDIHLIIASAWYMKIVQARQSKAH